jgi:hypothetical protein
MGFNLAFKGLKMIFVEERAVGKGFLYVWTDVLKHRV